MTIALDTQDERRRPGDGELCARRQPRHRGPDAQKMRRAGRTDVSDLQVSVNALTPVSEPLYAVA